LNSSRLKPHLSRVERLATQGATPEVRRPAYAAWVATAGADDPFLAATRTPQGLRDFLDAVPLVEDRVRESLYEKVRPLAFDLPPQLQASANEGGGVPGLRVEFFHPFSQDVTQEALAGQQPLASDEASEVSLNLPIVQQGEQFALRFTATLQVPQSGTYRFWLISDDGSRLYVDQRELINHDGPHGMTEKSAGVELSAGPHPIVVTYRNITGDKGLQLLWEGPSVQRQPLGGDSVTIGGGNSLQQAAILALATIGGNDDDKFAAFASLMASGSERPAVIRALGMLPPRTWPADQAGNLVDNLLGYVSSLPPRSRTGDSAVAAIDLVKSLAKSLSADQAADALNRLESLDVRVIALGVVPHRMIYDKEQMVVGVGETVEFRFANIDAMPHNFAIVRPGALREVGELAEATSSEPDAPARGYVPKSDQILLASRLLQPGDKQSLSFTAPLLPGVYPYVCTYPGHWRRMYGALYVVEDLEAYQSNPDAYLAAARLPVLDEQLESLGRNREWTFEELAKDVLELPAGRSYEVGKQLFATASCQACHKLAGEGYEVGPDLAKLDEKKHNTEYILRSLLEPSRDIDAKYQNHTFLLDTGLVVTGMIVGETADEVQVVIDPLAKSHPTTIRKAEIEERSPSDISPMPTGLLNRLTQEEILDLIAFVYAGGDPEAEIYADGHHHHHHGDAPSVDHDHDHEDAHGHEHDHDHGHGDEHEHE
jgi:putative heme-binding domain-containing protein